MLSFSILPFDRDHGYLLGIALGLLKKYSANSFGCLRKATSNLENHFLPGISI